MVKNLFYAMLISFVPLLAGDTAIVDEYVLLGLEGNLALKQKDTGVREGLAALREARGLFLPAITIEARYSRAGGGRNIEFPVGDLLNPVYQTLNGLLMEERFGRVENVSIPFLREEEHDTKARLVQPLFRGEIVYNHRIRQGIVEAREAEKRALARQLVADIKRAYFTYLKTEQIKTLLLQTEKLLTENLRISQSLFDNQKATEEVVFRARAELSELKEHQAAADRDVAVAAAYLNFLLNRPLDSPIKAVADDGLVFLPLPEASESVNSAIAGRDEFKQIAAALKLAGNQTSLSRSAYLPNANLVIDYGFQGEEYRFSGDDDYWMASVVLSWNIFNGFSDRARVQRAKISEEQIGYQEEELERQIRFQVLQAHQQMRVAEKTLSATEDRLSSARRSFRIVEKKYREGISPQIEYLDARTTLTNSEINRIIARYDYQIRHADLELAAATYPLNL